MPAAVAALAQHAMTWKPLSQGSYARKLALPERLGEHPRPNQRGLREREGFSLSCRKQRPAHVSELSWKLCQAARFGSGCSFAPLAWEAVPQGTFFELAAIANGTVTWGKPPPLGEGRSVLYMKAGTKSLD